MFIGTASRCALCGDEVARLDEHDRCERCVLRAERIAEELLAELENLVRAAREAGLSEEQLREAFELTLGDEEGELSELSVSRQVRREGRAASWRVNPYSAWLDYEPDFLPNRIRRLRRMKALSAEALADHEALPLVEAVERRPKAFKIFRRTGGGERPQRAAVKGAVEGDDAVALGMALAEVIAARDLDGAFHRLGAGIGEEHEIGKALLAQPCRELVTVWALEQVRHVPQLGGLLLQRRDQMRVAMAERIDRNPAGEIEVALAVGGGEPAALAALETEIDPGKDGKQMRRGAIGHGGH